MENLAAGCADPATLQGMSFDDLPSDWPTRPLTDPTIARDVVDLVVREADRAQGCLSILLCSREHRLVQPVTINDVEGVPPHERRRPFDVFLSGFADRLGGIVVAVQRTLGVPVKLVGLGEVDDGAVAASDDVGGPVFGGAEDA